MIPTQSFLSISQLGGDPLSLTPPSPKPRALLRHAQGLLWNRNARIRHVPDKTVHFYKDIRYNLPKKRKKRHTIHVSKCQVHILMYLSVPEKARVTEARDIVFFGVYY